MRPIQRYLAAGLMTAATLGTAAAIAPAAQATEAAAGPCDLKKPYTSVPVPNSSDPVVKLSVGLAKVDPGDPKDEKRTRFRVLYCPNKADKKHLGPRGAQKKVVLKVTLTKGKKTYTAKCEQGQYFRRYLLSPNGRPLLVQDCYTVAPKSPKGWKATGVLTYDVVTDKRGPFTYRVTNSKLK